MKNIAMDIDRLMREHYPDTAPGACVLVAVNGEVVLAKGYGVADLATSTPVTTKTRFRLASVTKQFTAMAVLLLAEEGKLSLDDRLTDRLSDFPEYGRAITIRHILNHTSGLKDYEDLIPPEQTEQVHDADVLEILKRAPGTDFPPGSQYHYSNSGYAILALIVERTSGMRFADFLKRRVFEPAGMAGAVAYEKGVSEVASRAFGAKEVDGRWVDADQGQTTAVLGDGGIYCSVEEYLKWDQALYGDRLIPQSRLAEAFTPGVLTDGTRTKYGFGWRIEEVSGRRGVGHTGSTSGFDNSVRRVPDLRTLVVVFSNRRGDLTKELAPKIEGMLLENLEDAKGSTPSP